MYSLVLMAAMAGGGGSAGQGYFHADPCCWCLWPIFPLGGEVVFFWAGPAALSDAEEKEWQAYIDALDEADKADAVYFWKRADRAGRYKLLEQVRALRAKKDEYDRVKRELEKGKEAEPKKVEKKDKDKAKDKVKDKDKDKDKDM